MAQTLAHLGQRYQAPPAASFDERFGPYQSGPMTEQELLRRLYEQQMLQQPGAVAPGYQERFGDPTKVISQSLPPQPLSNLGATTGGPTLSDVSADPVMAGQQYAMEAKRDLIPLGPSRSGVTAGGGGTARPYQSAPDTLMGFRRSGPNVNFDDSKFPHVQRVEITLPNGDKFTDHIKGLNQSHALERARRNWEGAVIAPIK